MNSSQIILKQKYITENGCEYIDTFEVEKVIKKVASSVGVHCSVIPKKRSKLLPKYHIVFCKIQQVIWGEWADVVFEEKCNKIDENDICIIKSHLIYIAVIKKIRKILPKIEIQGISNFKDGWKSEKRILRDKIINRYLFDYNHFETNEFFKGLERDGRFVYYKRMYPEYGYGVNFKVGKRQKNIVKGPALFKTLDSWTDIYTLELSIKRETLLDIQKYHYRMNRLEPFRKLFRQKLENWRNELWKPPNGVFAKRAVTFSSNSCV